MLTVRWAVSAQNLLLNIYFFLTQFQCKNVSQTALWIVYVKVLGPSTIQLLWLPLTYSYYLLPYKYVAVAREYTDLLTNWYSNDFSSHNNIILKKFKVQLIFYHLRTSITQFLKKHIKKSDSKSDFLVQNTFWRFIFFYLHPSFIHKPLFFYLRYKTTYFWIF